MPADSSTPPRVDGSMSLLVDMSAAALDPAYADAHARRLGAQAQDGGTGGDRTRTPSLLLVVLLVVGAVSGVAVAQVRRSAHVADHVRRSLVADVRTQTDATDALARQAEALRKQVAAARDQALGDDSAGRSLSARVSALELLTGQTPVTGPGLQVTMSDAPDADSVDGNGRAGQLGDGRIYDRDLQDVANALWAAGAEAIAINGQRLTSLTAIRSAGESVLVDFRPLASPYVLKAIGDLDALDPGFADGATARRFLTYTSLYGLGFSVRRERALALPAAGPPELLSARAGGPS
jgi:uncharacterized protein YlxW (UPF0749 family)